MDGAGKFSAAHIPGQRLPVFVRGALPSMRVHAPDADDAAAGIGHDERRALVSGRFHRNRMADFFVLQFEPI